MSRRIVLPELDAVDQIIASQGLYFDEENIAPGDTVVFQERPLRQRIRENFLSGGCYVELEEHDPISLLKKVRLENIDAESLVLKPDHFGVRHYKSKTWNKACDFLVLTKFDNKKYALFLELKTSISEAPVDGDDGMFLTNTFYDKQIAWQMIGADASFDGILDVVSKLGNGGYKSVKDNKKKSGNSLLADYKRRYVVFYQKVVTHSEGVRSTGIAADPNVYSLESPIRALKAEGETYTVNVGDLFARGVCV